MLLGQSAGTGVVFLAKGLNREGNRGILPVSGLGPTSQTFFDRREMGDHVSDHVHDAHFPRSSIADFFHSFGQLIFESSYPVLHFVQSTRFFRIEPAWRLIIVVTASASSSSTAFFRSHRFALED